MSKATDFLAHLGEAPQTSEQLQDASGEDSKTVSNRLTQLKGMGLAKRGKEGWIATGKAIVATDATMTVAVPPPRDPSKSAPTRSGWHATRRRARR